MLFFDLNSESDWRHTSGSLQEAMAYEFRKDRLCAINALYLHVRVQQMCRPLQRQPQGKNPFVLGPVSFHVLRPAYLSGESPGYRGMSSGGRAEIVPRRHTGKDITEYPGKRQPDKRLAYICRFCADSYRKSEKALPQRLFRNGSGPYRLCSGLNYHRSLPLPFPLGTVQE